MITVCIWVGQMNVTCALHGSQSTSGSKTAFQPHVETERSADGSNFCIIWIHNTVTTPTLFKTQLRLGVNWKHIHFNMNAIVMGQSSVWGLSHQTHDQIRGLVSIPWYLQCNDRSGLMSSHYTAFTHLTFIFSSNLIFLHSGP